MNGAEADLTRQLQELTARVALAAEQRDEARGTARRLRATLDAVAAAIELIPQHLGATWWGQNLRAALLGGKVEDR